MQINKSKYDFIKKKYLVFVFTYIFSLLIPSPLFINYIKSSSLEKDVIKNESLSYKEEYILGPGDILSIIFLEANEFSGDYSIGPDGLMYFPEIGPLKASKLTIAELEQKLKREYQRFLVNPSFSIYILNYRVIKTLIIGEVERPGFYNLQGVNFPKQGKVTVNSSDKNLISNNFASSASTNLFPSLYDAIRIAGGITLYSDITNIEVIRENSLSNGGGKIKANINLLSLIQDGDQSQNIRIYDGDTIKIKKSSDNIGKQIIQARKTNLNPDTINVFVGGNVKFPGKKSIPSGAGLNQAIELSGGIQLFSGKVVFLSFDNDGNIKKRVMKYKQNKKINSYWNPQLSEGDIIHVRDSLFGKTTEAVGEVTRPIVGIYGLYGIIEKVID